MYGRVIADLPPGEWCSRALDHIVQCVQDLQLGPVKGHSLKRRLHQARGQLVHRPGTWWDYTEASWIVNAEQEHRREPFAAIVSPDFDGPDDDNRKYHPNDVDRSIAAWNTRSGTQITRSPQALTQAILPMLRVASEIHFCDGYFNIDANSLYTKNYQQIIRNLASLNENFPAITIHCCPQTTPDLAYFEDMFKGHYEALVPIGKSITCVLWQTNEATLPGANPFHNRYVLSNHCGIFVGYGTDSANAATEAPDTLQFLDHETFQMLLNQSRRRTHPMISVYREIIIRRE